MAAPLTTGDSGCRSLGRRERHLPVVLKDAPCVLGVTAEPARTVMTLVAGSLGAVGAPPRYIVD